MRPWPVAARLVAAWRRSLCIAPTLLLLSCATGGDDRVLVTAEKAVERARSAPRVRALAPRELDHAEEALADAAAMVEAGAAIEWVDHFAYLATRRAALAEARADERIARKHVAALNHRLDAAVVPAAALRPAGGRANEAQSSVIVSLAEMGFDGAEPGPDAVRQLRSLAEAIRADASRRVLLVASFEAPDPEERTTLERRVEIVAGLLARHGVAPSRILVRSHTGPHP